MKASTPYNPPSMRIALLTTRSGPQAARFAALCGGLAARGHAVAAVCPPCVALPPGVAHLSWRGAGAWWNPLSSASLALSLTGFRPDLIHAHGDLAAAAAVKVGRKLGGWPRVASLSDRVAARGFVGAFDQVLLSSPAALARFHAHHPAVPAEAVFPAPSPMAPAAEGAGRALRERLGVPWGVPVALVVMQGAREEGPALAADAAWGLADLTQLWEWVGEAELWVAGDGSPQAKALEAQCRNVGRLIAPGYERGGQVNGIRFFDRHTDRATLLDACDLAVLPPRMPGQTAALAAALCAQKPVLAAGNAWAPGVLPAEYAVAGDDANAWREALAAAVSDVGILKAAQQEVFVCAKQEWTLAAMAEKTEAVYAGVLASRLIFPG